MAQFAAALGYKTGTMANNIGVSYSVIRTMNTVHTSLFPPSLASRGPHGPDRRLSGAVWPARLCDLCRSSLQGYSTACRCSFGVFPPRHGGQI